MVLAVVVGLAGAGGAVARYLVDGAVQDRTAGDFPFGTLTVNLAGSAVLGLLAGLVIHHGLPAAYKIVVGTGFCGGLTTWSAAAWESIRLAEEGSPGHAVAFTASNLVASAVVAAVAFAVTAA